MYSPYTVRRVLYIFILFSILLGERVSLIGECGCPYVGNFSSQRPAFWDIVSLIGECGCPYVGDFSSQRPCILGHSVLDR